MSSNQSTPTFTGQCHCGLIKYTSSSPPQNLTYCYCITCRRLSGSPFIAWADIPASSLAIPNDTNTDTLKTLTSDIAERTICGECGSSITMKYGFDETNIGIAAGAMDEGSLKGEVMKVTGHIFVEQKPSWYEIPEDGVKRWERFSDGFEEKLDMWRR
ncbi:MAG: hypothetical protein L6R38_001541 [Xanthoria sp. 2 TBL-2021]|nr:MAG: hypothetical protein L6R38_001541 [Xanthoria sp. 2 TBL-2021]